MPASRSADTEPSVVALVTRVLTEANDFMIVSQITDAINLLPGHSFVISKRVRTALWWLQKSHVVEAVESSRQLHWFITPAYDTRMKTFDERKKEDEPRRHRK